MFEEAGVDWKNIVDNGWTMDDFVAAGKKISRDTDGDGENDIFLSGFQTQRFHLTDIIYVLNHGGSILNEDETAFTLDSKEFIEGLQFLVDAIYKHKIVPKGAETSDSYGVIKPFHAHNLAMGYGGPYELGRIDRYVKRGDTVRLRPYIVPYPGVPSVKRVTYLDGYNFNILKVESDAAQDASIEFARFLSSTEMSKLQETVLYLSARKSSNAKMFLTEKWKKFKPDIDLYARELSEYGMNIPCSLEFGPKWNKVQKYYISAMQAVYARDKTPEEAMRDFIAEANPIVGF